MTFYFQKAYRSEIEQLLYHYYHSLSEKDRRRFAAVEAIGLGHGGISYIESVLGCSRKTIERGIRELKQLPNDTTGKMAQSANMTQVSIHQKLPEVAHIEAASPITLLSYQSLHRPTRVKAPYRVRQLGGGRKLMEEQHPTVVAMLEQMLGNENEVAGDPMTEQKWVRSSTRQLSKRLNEVGHQVSHATVGRLLKDMGFSLKANQRKQVRSKNPERDKQFQYISSQRQGFTSRSLPIISIDTKKKN